MDGVRTPVEDIAGMGAAEERLDIAISTMRSADVARAAALPGWSVGHLLTHLARNADSHRRRAEGARRDEVVDQYVGGPAGRTAEIECGADRPFEVTVTDLRDAVAAMLAAFDGVAAHEWSRVSRDGSGRERILAELPARRWLEVEVHLVDLDCGISHRDWPDAFVGRFLAEARAAAPERLQPGASIPAPGTIDARDELAFIYGRIEVGGYRPLRPW